MNSLKFLYEMFLADARFPDEKFWDKNGDPIHPDPKGPPKGTKGVTHRELGYWDVDDRSPGDDGPGDPNDYPSKDQFDGQTIYPNIDTVKEDPEMWRAFEQVLRDLGVSEKDLPEEAFLLDDDGNMTATIPHTVANDGMTHELWWNKPAKQWEYVT